VIDGLQRFGMRPCDGGYMADRWSHSLADWCTILHERVAAPTPDAIVDADVFLDLRPLTRGLDVAPAAAELALGAQSPRLMHGLAQAANSFPAPLNAFGRLPKGAVDLKKSGLAPIVLLARLYGLRAGSAAVGTDPRLADAASAGVLSEDLIERLREGYALLTRLRLGHQLQQIDARQYVTDTLDTDGLDDADHDGLRDVFRAIKSAQSVTSVTFRTDL
jgi:CBS domain-containing protein